MEKIKFVVDESQSGERIDKCVCAYVDTLSRSYIQKLIKEELISVNNKKVKANYRVGQDDFVILSIPALTELDIEPEYIPLTVLFEDEDVIVINKSKDMVVHPAPGHMSGTLVNALLYQCKGNLSGINGIMRPGIVHRIDKDTTGALIVCKNDFAHNFIANQLKEHSITRKYRAIVCGIIKAESGIIVAPIGRHPVDRKKMAINEINGKQAITHYKVLKRFSKFTYIECELETGRTHQIRVHMASIGYPLLGDTVYGRQTYPYKTDGQVLHAMILGFIHPRTGEYIECKADLPAYFEKLLHILS